MAKAQAQTPTERPKALDVLTNIVEMVIPFRYPDRSPTISDIARLTGTASRVLRYDNIDERIETENPGGAGGRKEAATGELTAHRGSW